MRKNSAHYNQNLQNPSLKLPKAILSIDRTTHHAPRTTHHAPRTTHHAPRTTHHAPRTTQLYTLSRSPCQQTNSIFFPTSDFISLRNGRKRFLCYKNHPFFTVPLGHFPLKRRVILRFIRSGDYLPLKKQAIT
jgi:hypothetical protein